MTKTRQKLITKAISPSFDQSGRCQIVQAYSYWGATSYDTRTFTWTGLYTITGVSTTAFIYSTGVQSPKSASRLISGGANDFSDSIRPLQVFTVHLNYYQSSITVEGNPPYLVTGSAILWVKTEEVTIENLYLEPQQQSTLSIPIKVGDMAIEEAKPKVEDFLKDYMKKHDEVYPSDVADELRLSYGLVREIFDLLEKERKLKLKGE